MTEQLLNKILDEHVKTVILLKNDPKLCLKIKEAGVLLFEAFKSGSKLLLCGNGGSAADSQHIATEFVSRFYIERKALDAETLTINTSSLTAIGNDYSFDKVYSRQVEAKGKKGDILIAISTSGNSKNVIEAIKTAKDIGLKTIGLTNNDKGNLISKLTDCCINVPSSVTPRVQEAHILIGHILCEFVEAELFRD
ncbi:MAG: SIS domain-containing protein [bacterium]|nr:SIS domain-containing protein [bacterium]